MSKKLLGFDFGMKYIGVATGQLVTNSVTQLTSVKAQDGIPDWNEIKSLIEKWQPDILVVGIPYDQNGSPQDITFCAKKFANRLREKFKLQVCEIDETLTTWQARHSMDSGNKRDFDKLNSQAAAIILQDWINHNN